MAWSLWCRRGYDGAYADSARGGEVATVAPGVAAVCDAVGATFAGDRLTHFGLEPDDHGPHRARDRRDPDQPAVSGAAAAGPARPTAPAGGGAM
jgi:hypothetical protein